MQLLPNVKIFRPTDMTIIEQKIMPGIGYYFEYTRCYPNVDGKLPESIVKPRYTLKKYLSVLSI